MYYNICVWRNVVRLLLLMFQYSRGIGEGGGGGAGGAVGPPPTFAQCKARISLEFIRICIRSSFSQNLSLGRMPPDHLS